MENFESMIKNCAFDSAGDAIVLADLSDNIIYINKAFLELWGCEKKNEVIGKPAAELWEDQKEVLRLLKKLHKKERWLHELVALKRDGTTFEARVSASLVKDADGKSIGTMALIIDITVPRRLEKVQELIYQISEMANFSQNLDVLYKNIHEVVKGLMPADNFYIGLYDNKTGLIHFPYSVDEKDTDDSPIKPGKTLTAHVIKTGEPLLISRETFEELKEKGEVEQVGTPSKYWLGVPLKTTGLRTIGVLAVQIYEKGREYTEEDKNMLAFVSTQIAKAIERKQDEQRKEMMLQEIHHRVKNNFNFISSLLDLQCRQIKDQSLKKEFLLAQDRIRSMAMVHEKLYQSEDFSEINFARYIKELTDFLYQSHGTEDNKISVKLKLEDVFLSIDKAIPCGLIINELFSNSLKYAFPTSPSREKPDGQKHEIIIELYRKDVNTLVLGVRDNGVGLPKDLDFFETSSLGIRLVRLLSKQIHGTIELDQSSGTAVCIKFEI
jgi:PAS domain S-box-containing protein